MNLKIEDLMKKIGLPKRYFNNNFVISEKFSEEKEKFLSLIRQCKGDEFDGDKKMQLEESISQIIKVADNLSNIILDIFAYYENADYKRTQELMDELMLQIEKDIFIGSIDDRVYINYNDINFCRGFRVTPGYRFFRVRAVDYESPSIQKNADELFHIPLSKRAYSNNERFSLVGFPSLYLSTMLPLAWQECGYPHKYYYSEYQYKYSTDWNSGKRSFEKELKFLLLYSPSEIAFWGMSIKYSNFELWLEVIKRYLKTYPLILACSFVNQSGKVPYKQEYIIPQMLMQWVQRNSSKVQGIEYFTCADISMRTSEWCAYNIVIPAMPPYDDKKYSIPLKDKFCWTVPQFYSVPILDKSYNEADREFIYNLVSKIRNAIRRFSFPDKYHDSLIKMINICGCLMSLLENQSAINMQLVLQILNALSENISGIRRLQLDKDIEKEIENDGNVEFVDEIELKDACSSFKEIYYSFVDSSGYSECIARIINKHKDFCWNDSHPHSEILLIYYKDYEIDDPEKWLNENHILHNICKIDSSDKSIEYLKKIALEAEVSLDEFWGCHVEDDEWIKDNIDKVKTPIFVKISDVSIYSKPGTKSVEMVSVGFDKDILSDKLIY